MSSVPAQQDQPFVLGQAAPDAVHLSCLERVPAAFGDDGTAGAHVLGPADPFDPFSPTFTPGMEEECAGHAATGGVDLPLP